MNYVWFVRGATHAAMCQTAIESVRAMEPLAKCYIVTDERKAERAWDSDEVVWEIASGMPIMLANLEAQIAAAFAIDRTTHDPILFIDTDILMVKPFESFTKDMLVTWRSYIGETEDGEKVEGVAASMPYNYGVMGINPSQYSIEALIWLRERVRRMHAKHQQWYGNQLALAALAGPRPAEGTTVDYRSIPWTLTGRGAQISVEKRPCTEWNYTPKRLGEDIAGKHFLHFKGGSRGLMQGYAQRLGLGWYVKEKAA